MSHKSINEALSIRLQAMGYETAFENAPFTPTHGTLYLEGSYLPAETVPVGMEYSSSEDYRGIYQVSVKAPRDKYKADAYTAVDAVAAQFARGTELVRDDITVRIERVFASTPIYGTASSTESGSEADRFSIPVSIYWRAFVK